MKVSRENVTLISVIGGAIVGISVARTISTAFVVQAVTCVIVAVLLTVALRAALRWQLGRGERPR